MKLNKKMIKDKGYDVEYPEINWVQDKMTKKWHKKKQKVYGTYVKYDGDTKNHLIKTRTGEILQINNFKRI
jgi:hypothetical protein